MKVLIAISASIAFYKSYELISMFKKEGIKVKALLSKGLLDFVNPISFEALCEEVLYENNQNWQNNLNHIAFSKDCDLIIFAPASVNSINKLANGICDNLFIQTLIAANKPLIIAPAANTNMYLHFSTQESLEKLRKNNAIIINPVCKELACKDVGVGALASVESIFNAAKKELFKIKEFENKNILITGGACKEDIDGVRCISNYSSGKMASALAKQAYFYGANVVFLNSFNFSFDGIKSLNFSSSKELWDLMQEYKNYDYLFMVAAVSDFVPIKLEHKLNRNEFKDELNIKIKANFDLVKNYDFKGKKIAFKLESDENIAFNKAQNAFFDKNLKLLCLNILGKNVYFGNDESEFYLYDGKNFSNKIVADKTIIAKEILKVASNV